MKNNFVYVWLLLIIIISCGQEKKENGIKQLDVWTDSSSYIKASTVAKRVMYITLENPENSILSEVSKFRIFNNSFLILDMNLKCLFRYSLDGRYICQSNNFGKGPLEILCPTDFFVDTLNGCIELLDVGSRKIVFYNQNLQPFREIKNMTLGERNFFKIDHNKYLLFQDNYPFRNINKALIEIDTMGKVLQSFLSNEDILFIDLPDRNIFNEYKNSIIFNRSATNEITEFNINEEVVKVKYQINFKNFKFPNEIFEDYAEVENKKNISHDFLIKFINTCNSGNYAFNISNLFESESHLIFTYTLSSTSKVFTVVDDKMREKITNGMIQNDLGKYKEFGKPVLLAGKNLYTIIDDTETEKQIVACYELK